MELYSSLKNISDRHGPPSSTLRCWPHMHLISQKLTFTREILGNEKETLKHIAGLTKETRIKDLWTKNTQKRALMNPTWGVQVCDLMLKVSETHTENILRHTLWRSVCHCAHFCLPSTICSSKHSVCPQQQPEQRVLLTCYMVTETHREHGIHMYECRHEETTEQSHIWSHIGFKTSRCLLAWGAPQKPVWLVQDQDSNQTQQL